jgi:GxxExxY protein
MGGPIPDATNEVARVVVDSVFRVHSTLGPGLIESVYEACICHELSKRGLAFETRLELPIVYDGMRLDSGLRLDLVVERCLIVELKVVEHTLPVHRAQLLTYLKITGYRLGLLINFQVSLIKNGIERIAH